MEPQSLSQLLEWEPNYPDAIISGGILYSESKVIMYGRYKSFKSMAALYTAMAIADGRPWFGFDTPKLGASVLYAQSEIPHPLLKKRVDKMWEHWNLNIKGRQSAMQPIYLWTEPYFKLDSTEGLALISRHLAHIKPEVLIIDPVYKVMSGNILDPNSVRSLLDTIDKIISEHHVSVIMVHHPRKSGLEEDMEWGSDDMLGSVLFSAWADTIIKIIRKGGGDRTHNLQLNFEIARHAEEDLGTKEVVFNRDTLAFTIAEEIIHIT